ncbi:MAG: carboxypeptidase regulatory-like domain-containing protein [Candidatus Electrothrix sp. AUS1_2]|nr:carboxypeptidase regulatory-like domain-containing protein [Candidatus Electrothrix sp. AUS1_2]
MKTRLIYRILTVLFISFCYCVLPTADKARAGSITGTVVDDDGGAFIGDVRVAVYAENNAAKIIAEDNTDAATGAYSITGLDNGDYKVWFITDATDYIKKWYNDSTDFSGAQTVSLTSATPDVDLEETALTLGGKITGTVTYNAASPTEPVYVQAYNAVSGAWVKTTQVNSSTGEYTVRGLPAGGYTVKFWAFLTEYVTAWYNDTLSRNTATSVSVAQGGSETLGINAQLVLGGKISGTVTDIDGNPVEGTLVQVYDSLDSEELRGFAYTGETGIYTVKGLPLGGSVKVRFCERQEADGSCGGLTEWYDDKINFDSADIVTVPDTGIDGIDAVLESRFNWWLFTPALTHRPAAL